MNKHEFDKRRDELLALYHAKKAAAEAYQEAVDATAEAAHARKQAINAAIAAIAEDKAHEKAMQSEQIVEFLS